MHRAHAETASTQGAAEERAPAPAHEDDKALTSPPAAEGPPLPLPAGGDGLRIGNLRVSQAFGRIADAIAKAQAAMNAASKDATNPHFKSKYADLAAVWDVLRSTLSASGVAVVQAPGIANKHIVVTTLLAHGSGEWMSADLPMPLAQWSAHAIGSAITYGRRYALSMCGVAPDDDDDGHAAVGMKEIPHHERSAARRDLPADQTRLTGDILRRIEKALVAKSLDALTKIGPDIQRLEDGPEKEEAKAAYFKAKTALTPTKGGGR